MRDYIDGFVAKMRSTGKLDALITQLHEAGSDQGGELADRRALVGGTFSSAKVLGYCPISCGVWVTLRLGLISASLGLVLGLVLALMKYSRHPLLYWPARSTSSFSARRRRWFRSCGSITACRS